MTKIEKLINDTVEEMTIEIMDYLKQMLEELVDETITLVSEKSIK